MPPNKKTKGSTVKKSIRKSEPANSDVQSSKHSDESSHNPADENNFGQGNQDDDVMRTEENLLGISKREDQSVPMKFQNEEQFQPLRSKSKIQLDVENDEEGFNNQDGQESDGGRNQHEQEDSQSLEDEENPFFSQNSRINNKNNDEIEEQPDDEKEELRSVQDENLSDDSELTVKINDDDPANDVQKDELQNQPTFYNVPVRRQTIARMKALESDSEDDVSSDGQLSNDEAREILLKTKTHFGGFAQTDNNKTDIQAKYAKLVADDPELERKTPVFEFEFKPMKKFKAEPLEEEFDERIETDDGDQVVMPQINVRNLRSDDKVSKNAIEIVSVDKRELLKQELKVAKVQEDFQDTYVEKTQQEDEIKKSTDETSKTLKSRKKVNLDIIKKKQERAIADYKIKTKVLQSNFKDSLRNIIGKVKRQKHIIMQSYGPLVLNPKQKEKPIFEINKDLDPEGYKWYSQLSKEQDNIPQALMIKMHTVRCMKDKVSSGHFMMMVSVLDAVGGNKFQYDTKDTTKNYRQLSRALKDFVRKKRTFLDKENRQMETKAADGSTQFVKAAATGAAFFQQQTEKPEDNLQQKSVEQQIEEEMKVNMQTDVHINLQKNYSDYVRFNAKASDENIDIKDTVSVLIPPNCDSTNVLMFELILLASEVIPRDYVVGWGLFPLVNSDFQLNEGKFKVPLLFGTVDSKFDKFKKIEEAMLSDLDKWVANFYFEIEKIKLMDIKVDQESGDLYYRPLGVHTEEKNENKDNSDSSSSKSDSSSSESESNSQSDTDSDASGPTINTASVISVSDDGKSKGESSFVDTSMDSEEREQQEIEKQARLAAEEIADVVYDNTKLDEEIIYDQYHFAVAEKYDLTTRRLTFKKFKYIADEVFLDLRLAKYRTIEFQLAVLYILFLFFLRTFIHYTGQYMFAAILGVPVTRFNAYFYYIDLEYAAWTLYQEVIIVLAGNLCNSIVFLLSVLIAHVSKWRCGCYPRIFYKIICWHGIMTILDPYFTLLFDTVTTNRNGDWFKFYFWYLSKQGSGIVGAYFSVFCVLSLTIFNITCFYFFMIFKYMNGRILDLYRRLSGQYKTFFMPLDNEVSMKYLQWVITRCQKIDCIISSESKLIHDKVGIQRKVQFVTIYKHWKGILQKSRMFFKDYDGSIIEVPQNKATLKPSEAQKLMLNLKTDNATIYGENHEMVQELLQKTAEFNGGKDEIAEEPAEDESDSDSNYDPRLNSEGGLKLLERNQRAPSTEFQSTPLSPVKLERDKTVKAEKTSKLDDQQAVPYDSNMVAPATHLMQINEAEDDKKSDDSGESDFL